MRRSLAALFLLATTVPLQAESFCDDLWFARNQLMDRAGYCFSSPLGQAVFDNTSCIGKSVTLDPGAAAMVAEIQASEARAACNVDTSRKWLDVPNMHLRLQLDQPVYRSDFESSCQGWRGAPLTLFAGPNVNSRAMARVETGDDFLWNYDSSPWPEGWTFLSLYRDGVEIALGWRPYDFDETLCTTLAG